MDIGKEILDTKQSIAEVALEIKELKSSLQNAAADEKTEVKASIARLQQKDIELQRQLAELYKRLPLSK